MSKYSGENAPSVIFVLMFMPFVGATIGILTGVAVDRIGNLIEKRRDSDA